MANLDRVLPFPVLPLPTLPLLPPLDREQLLDEREEIVVAVEVGGAELATAGARRLGIELRFSSSVGVVSGWVTPPTTREA